MQNNFELPLLLLPETPALLNTCTNIIHVGAITLTLVSAIPWIFKVFLVVLVIFNYRNIRGKFLLRSHPDSVIRVLCDEDDEWWLTTADGVTRHAELQLPCFVHASLVILAFKTGSRWWQCNHVMLVPGSVDTDCLRRLRVRLRFPKRATAGMPASG